MLIEQLIFNYPIYSEMSLLTEYEGVLTAFLADVSYKLVKLSALTNNMLLRALTLSCMYQL